MSRWSMFKAAGPRWDLFQTDGDLAPEDLIASRVCELLRDNARLRQVFGDRIEVIDGAPSPADARTLPRLQIHTTSVRESQNPTLVDVNLIQLFITIRWDAADVPVVKLYHPTVASVKRQILITLKALKSLHVWINGDEANASILANELVSFGEFSYESPGVGERVIRNVEISPTYRSHVHHTTQRIISLAARLDE